MKRIYAIILPVFCFSSLLFISGCSGDSQKKELKACENNQRKILIELTAYAANNKDKLPADLSVLTKEYTLKAENLVCPAAKDGNSYQLLNKDIATYSPDKPVICCRAHKDKTVVGYADGHVDTIDGELPVPAVTQKVIDKAYVSKLRVNIITSYNSFKLDIFKVGRKHALYMTFAKLSPPMPNDDEGKWENFRKTLLKFGDDDKIIKSCSQTEFDKLLKALTFIKEYDLLMSE